MEFIGEIVKHKAFGLGKITEFNETYIVVKFSDETEKAFVFPDSFDTYLALQNEVLSKQVDEKLIVYREKEAERKVKEEELKREELLLRMMREELEHAKKTGIKKVDSNIAFKCTYCDGGSNENNIGYREVCSDENIDYNINVAKSKSCIDSACNYYLQGSVTREELVKGVDEGNIHCYESQLLNQWRAYPDIKFIENGGKTKNIKNVNQGSVVLLTTILPNEKEKDRIIFGAYFLEDKFDLEYKINGYLGAYDKHRIELSLEEAKMLKFWDFYYNKNNPEKINNSSVLYRYFDDMQSAQVLKAITEIKIGTEQEELSQEMFEHYCKIKNINVEKVSQPAGALQVKTKLADANV